MKVSRILLISMIIFFSVLYIFIIPSDPEIVKLIFKLIPMLLIIGYAWSNLPAVRERMHILIMIGLVFSTIGDATLGWFVIGLTAFLIGHLFYISAFKRVASVSLPKLVSLLILVPFAVWMGVRLVQSLSAQGESFLIIPVLAYIMVIMIMCFIAILTGNIFAIIGSILFVISDAVLAWNMFVQSIHLSSLYIMTSYYGAQFFIASSMATINKK